MADGIDVPINLPTDSSGVKVAADALKALQGSLKALGPAAEKGSTQAVSALARVGASAAKIQADLNKQKDRMALVGAKRDAAIEVANAKGFQAFQLQRQKAIFDMARRSSAQEDKERQEAGRTAQEKIKAARAVAKEREKLEKKRSENTKKDAEGRDAVSFSKMGNAVLGALGAITVKAIATGAAIAAALAGAFAVALVRAQAFKESTLGALDKLLGGAGKAQDAFKKTIVTAQEIGLSFEDALSGVNSLVAKGFGADQARELLKAMADLKSVAPDANIKNLLLAISQIKGKGKLQMEELQGQIAEAGLSVAVVLEEIGKKIGKSSDEVRKMIAAGKIDAEMGVQGILAAIQKTTGKPIGKAAAEAAASLSGLIKRVQDLPEALLLTADASKGMGAVKDVLGNLLAAMAPGTKTGDALASALGRLGDAFAQVLSGLTGANGKEAFTSFADGATKALDIISEMVGKIGAVVGPALSGFITGLGKGLTAGAQAGSGAKRSTVDYQKLGEALGKAAEAGGKLIGMLLSLIASSNNKVNDGGLGELRSKIESVVSLIGLAQRVYNEATQIGGALINGIIAGITGGQGVLAGAISAVVGMVTGAAQTGWQVHSPSRVFAWIGRQLPAGAAVGVEQGSPELNRAVARMTAGATGAATGGGGPPSPAPATRQAPVIGQLTVYARTEDDARAIADVVDARLRAAWGEMAYA